MKKLFSLFLCLILLFGLLPLTAQARAATALAVSSVKADKTSANVGAAVTWTATASGGTGTLKYYFILYKDGSKIATRAYSTANTFSYTPAEAGTYKVRVYVKDVDGAKVNKLSAAVTAAPLTLSSVKADKTSASIGAAVTWTASASGGSGTLKYYFILYKDGSKIATRSYSTAKTFSYTPTEAGTYKVRVYVKDADGAKIKKLSSAVTVAEAGITISSVKANKTAADTGETITWTAAASGGSGALKYYFILYKDGSRIATRSYSTAKTFSYTPSEAGTYKVRVYVKDADDTKISKLSGAVTVTPKGDLCVNSCIYIASTQWTESRLVNGRVVYYYRGYLNGVSMGDLALESAPKKTGFAAYSKSSSGIYTLHSLPVGNGDATGVRTVTVKDSTDAAEKLDCFLLRDKLYMRDSSGEWQALDVSDVTVIQVGNAATSTLSLNSIPEMTAAAIHGYKITITLVENVVGGVHSVGGGAIYITEITL